MYMIDMNEKRPVGLEEDVRERCDKILIQLGCDKIDLLQRVPAQKKFCRFVRDYGITAPAHVDFNYKRYRYLSNVEDPVVASLLFENATTWHGKIDGEEKLYFVAQPYRRCYTDNSVLELLRNEKKFLEFCRKNGHGLTLDFDNDYNWRGDEAFLIIVELERNAAPDGRLAVEVKDWGKKTVFFVNENGWESADGCCGR